MTGTHRDPLEAEEVGIEPIPEPEGETEIIETGYEVGQDNWSKSYVLQFYIHNPVFGVAAGLILAITLLTLFFQTQREPFSRGCGIG